MRVAVAGEALIDFTASGPLAFQGHIGGGPLNSAVAYVRLGSPTAFITQLSTDLFGEQLVAFLQRNGIDTRYIARSAAPSTLAFVERTPQTNRYAFYTQGSADGTWAPAELPALPDSCLALQFGSIALLQEPAAGRIADLVAAQAGKRLIVFDPNVRPSLIPDLDAYRARLKGWLAPSDLLKLSDEDAELLAPGVPLAQAAAGWLAAGPKAVVVTRGGAGATLFRAGHAELSVAAPQIVVADTIGAGDTFTAGLASALLDAGVARAAGLAALSDASWAAVLRFAAMAAAINCTREGANPPTLAEVQQALAN
ncbi:MAG: carbohydrate kinase [Proteobacteria bacterium]|nr:carbohydrate kinase [Pseudomonadota bacterium]